MTREQMEAIASRTARLAASYIAEDERKLRTEDPYQGYYEEHLRQLETGDTFILEWWLEVQIEEGIQEAVEIKKLWLKAQLAA